MSETWEDSKRKYTQLIRGLDSLIKESTELLGHYEREHTRFGYVIYENDLTDIMKDGQFLDEYEREFMLMYYSLKGQLERLKRYRKTVSMMTIKDPLNCPEN